ncbi:hypothetical protein [Pontibacter sp. H249]|uniref:hypothetical protein n=1 Tax=Pontibacter sp. H249 TaxID=3133420 RepID=UPI0030C1F01C
MKKITVLAAAIALVGFTSVDTIAQSNTQQTPMQQQQTPAQDANKAKITQDQLPQSIKEALNNEKFQDWTVSEVYKIAAATEGAKPTYEVQFTNSTNQRAVARFNEDGTAVKSEE